MNFTWQSRSASDKKHHAPVPLNVEQLEARMLCAIDTALDSLQMLDLSAVTVEASRVPTVRATTNAAPRVLKNITPAGGAVVKGKDVTLSAKGKDDGGEQNLKYNWQVVSGPAGATTKFSTTGTNASQSTKLTFSEPGRYTIALTITDAGGLSVTRQKVLTVRQQAKARQVVNSSNQTLKPGAKVSADGNTQSFSVTIVDQFGQPLTNQSAIKWSLRTKPAGGTAKAVTTGGDSTLTFNKPGTYQLVASSKGLSFPVTIGVAQKLTTIEVTPDTGAMTASTKLQFSFTALDQFGKPMAGKQNIRWSASSGRITSSGLYTAPANAGNVTIYAKSGNVTASVDVTVMAKLNIRDAALASLATSLYADGSLSRSDVMQILRKAGQDGTVSSTELSDMRYIVTNGTTFGMADYVKALAGNVVNGSPANSLITGAIKGNLAAGSTSALLTALVDKWFLGSDLPTLTSNSLSYRAATGSLFVSAPTRADERQGALGDCYFVSALGSLADSNPDIVTNMFIDNGDGTFTVRFYTGSYSGSGGFTTGEGTADYITVNRMLPAYSNGTFAYSNLGKSVTSSNTSLWLALAEKAYAQWNATGKEGRDGTNTFAGMEGGWMSYVYAQVTGRNATNYLLSNGNKQIVIDAIADHKALTIGTNASPSATNMVGSHAYSIVGYNANNDTFSLYNPWGTNHQTALTWAQIQANCTLFVMADTSTTTPIVAGQVRAELGTVQYAYMTVASESQQPSKFAWQVTSSNHDVLPGFEFARGHQGNQMIENINETIGWSGDGSFGLDVADQGEWEIVESSTEPLNAEWVDHIMNDIDALIDSMDA